MINLYKTTTYLVSPLFTKRNQLAMEPEAFIKIST